MPKFLYPIVAASSAIAYGIYSEYTWADRTIAEFPDTIKVVHELPGTSMFSPWTYVIPRIDRLSMIDTATIRRNSELPDHVMTELLLMQRFSPVVRVSQLVDCAGGRRTDVTSNAQFDADGLPANTQWEVLDMEHPLLRVLCS